MLKNLVLFSVLFSAFACITPVFANDGVPGIPDFPAHHTGG